MDGEGNLMAIADVSDPVSSSPRNSEEAMAMRRREIEQAVARARKEQAAAAVRQSSDRTVMAKLDGKPRQPVAASSSRTYSLDTGMSSLLSSLPGSSLDIAEAIEMASSWQAADKASSDDDDDDDSLSVTQDACAPSDTNDAPQGGTQDDERARKAAADVAAVAASIMASLPARGVEFSPRTTRRAEQAMAKVIDQAHGGNTMPSGAPCAAEARHQRRGAQRGRRKTTAAEKAARKGERMSGPAVEMEDEEAASPVSRRDAEKGVRGLLEQTEEPVNFLVQMKVSDEALHTLKSLEAERGEKQAEQALLKARSRRRASREGDADGVARGRGERHSL